MYYASVCKKLSECQCYGDHTRKVHNYLVMVGKTNYWVIFPFGQCHALTTLSSSPMKTHEDLDSVEKVHLRNEFSTASVEQAQQVHTPEQKMLRTDSMTFTKKNIMDCQGQALLPYLP